MALQLPIKCLVVVASSMRREVVDQTLNSSSIVADQLVLRASSTVWLCAGSILAGSGCGEFVAGPWVGERSVVGVARGTKLGIVVSLAGDLRQGEEQLERENYRRTTAVSWNRSLKYWMSASASGRFQQATRRRAAAELEADIFR
jgi:hypothetical protein